MAQPRWLALCVLSILPVSVLATQPQLPPPVAYAQCGDLDFRMASEYQVVSVLDQPKPAPLRQRDLWTDLKWIGHLDALYDANSPKKQTRFSELDRELRDNPRCVLVLCAYRQPACKDAHLFLDVMKECLTDPLPGTRALGAIAVGRFGRKGHSLRPQLEALLTDADPYVRLHAAFAHWQVTEETKAAIPALLDGLKSRKPHEADLAAMFLGRIGPNAVESTLPALIVAVNDDNPYVRSQACFAIGQMGKKAESAIHVLTTAQHAKRNSTKVDLIVVDRRTDPVTVSWTSASVASYARQALTAIKGE